MSRPTDWDPSHLVWRRTRFQVHARPLTKHKPPRPRPMSDTLFPAGRTSLAAAPAAVHSIASWIESQPNARDRVRWTLRDSIDSLLDGQHTGRWNYHHLLKTEKTHLGTTLEIMLGREFSIPEGARIDWQIAGLDVDCKFSKDYGGWEIPREMYLSATPAKRSGKANEIALLVWINDDSSEWAMGLLHVNDKLLSGAANGDDKRKLNKAGLGEIHWLWGGLQADLPSNQLLQLSDEERDTIFSHSSGQVRTNALLRQFNGRLVYRTTVLTVAQQADGMKRPRDARLRQHLGREGFVILGHQGADPYIAERLSLPRAGKGQFVPARLVGCDARSGNRTVQIGGRFWRLAVAEEPSVAAPTLPKNQPTSGWAAYLAGDG